MRGKRTEIPTDLKKYDFLKLSKRETHGRTKIRLLCFHHLSQGTSISAAAQAAGVHETSILSWVKKFKMMGLSGLYEAKRRQKICRLPKEKEIEFKERVLQVQMKKRGGRIIGKEIQELLKDEFGVTYTLHGVYKVLKRVGLSWVSARSKHPKSSPEEQEEFKKKFPEKIEQALPEDKKGLKLEIWFQDEARIGQQGTITRMWAPKGTRPRAIRQQQFEYAYLFGAVCPEKDKSVAIIMPRAITEAMEKHLEAISASVEEGHHAVIVLDRASWHTSKKLKKFENLTLLPLPPASPELNPQEQVWRELRQKYLANRCYSGYDDIVSACCEAWNDYTSEQGRIRNLCSRKWAKIRNF